MSYSWTSMKRIARTDCLISKHDLNSLGYPSTMTESEIIQLATENKIPLIIKAGKNAKWYLKGTSYSYEHLERMLNENQNKLRYERCYAILIKYV